MDSFLELAGIVDLGEFLEGWFMDTTAVDEIKHDNMIEFIAYGFYSKRVDALTEEERKEIEVFMKRVYKAFGQKPFKPGYNAEAKFMGHTLEPLRSFHKPLIIYAFMELIGVINMGILWWFGFKRLSSRRNGRSSRGTMSMFIRDYRPTKRIGETNGSHASKKEPLVFIHGVGLGILPYVHFLGQVLANISRPCIVVEMRHVSMRFSINHRSISLPTLANDIVDQMHSIGFQKGFFLSHSYGTFIVAKILQLRPEAVDRVCLIDPVCCMTCYPKLTRNFVYRSYQGWPMASKKRFMDFVQLLFSRDLTIADTFCRHLNGMDVNVFANDFPVNEGNKKHLLVLSGQDPLVPSHLVLKQFKGASHVDTLYNEAHGHGDFLFDSKYLAYLVVDLCARIEDESL